MGRTIIKFAGQKEEVACSAPSPTEKKTEVTESDALRLVTGENAEVVDQRFLELYFAAPPAQLGVKEAKHCATLYSSLPGDETQLNGKNLIYESWNC